jgi:hypothetical protein
VLHFLAYFSTAKTHTAFQYFFLPLPLCLKSLYLTPPESTSRSILQIQKNLQPNSYVQNSHLTPTPHHPFAHPAQVNLTSAMPPATSNINPILIASPPPFHAPDGIHSNTNSLLTNPDGSPIVAFIGPVSTAPHPLEKAMGTYTVSVPSATTIPSAALSATATATVNSSKSILKTDEELRAQAEHFAEMAEMHRLQKEDAGRQKEQEQREQQQQQKKKEDEERKNREGNRLWRILGVSIAATVVTLVFALLWAWLHAQKKMGKERLGKEVQGHEEREGREAGERIEMGLARRWAAEEVDARDGPTV